VWGGAGAVPETPTRAGRVDGEHVIPRGPKRWKHELPAVGVEFLERCAVDAVGDCPPPPGSFTEPTEGRDGECRRGPRSGLPVLLEVFDVAAHPQDPLDAIDTVDERERSGPGPLASRADVGHIAPDDLGQ